MTEDRARRVQQLRAAAGWLLAATLVIVVDFRIGGRGGHGVDVINDVVGAVLVLPGIAALRAAARDIDGTTPWTSIAWFTALAHVPVVLAEETLFVRGIGGTEELVAELVSLPLVFGGTAAAAQVFHRSVLTLTTDTDLAERWRKNTWWILIAGGLPALVATVSGTGLATARPPDTSLGLATVGAAALVSVVALAFGLMALIALVVALSRTRALTVADEIGTERDPDLAAPRPHPEVPSGSDASGS